MSVYTVKGIERSRAAVAVMGLILEKRVCVTDYNDESEVNSHE
ncbi:TPA: hypothetical protein ACGG8A_000959 [Vibrio cholerae]|nr:hypothetical protein [Vibrio cholerae]